MANRKLPYRWESVQPGDIISFKYKTKSTGKTRTHTLLVLNPMLLRYGKKTTTTQLIGIKLEESNKIQLDITRKQIQIFELIGKFTPLDPNSKDKNNLYTFASYSLDGGFGDRNVIPLGVVKDFCQI